MLTQEEKKKWEEKNFPFLERRLRSLLADTAYYKSVYLVVDISSNHSYTDYNRVQIGLEGEFEDDDALRLKALFLLEHEAQHLRSSTQKGLELGVSGGYMALLEEFSLIVFGKKGFFRKESDYKRLLDDLKNEGYFLSEKSLKEKAHDILNSIEDGRIERIAAGRSKTFKNSRIIVRRNDWEKDLIPKEFAIPFAKGHPKALLNMIEKQIHSLSVNGVYNKEAAMLTAKYQEDVFRLLESLKVRIRTALLAKTCRECAEICVEIDRIIAPYILETFKGSPSDDSGQGDGGQGECLPMPHYQADSKTEEKGDGNGSMAVFTPDSDLDEKKEEEKEQGSGSGSAPSGGGDEAQSQGSSSQAPASAEEMLEDAKNSIAPSLNAMAQAAEARGKRLPPEKIESSGADWVPEGIDDSNVRFTEKVRSYDCNKVMPEALQSKGRSLKRKIEEFFKNKQKPKRKGQKKGILDGGRIYRLPMGETDIFKKNKVVNRFSGCCYLLMDNSGSMGYGKGSKREACCEALSIIEEGFSSVMPLKITAFDSWNGVNHIVVKNWSEKIPRGGAYNFMVQGPSGGGNNDAYSIRVATEELLHRSERKKLLFVLSDGLPSDCSERAVHDAVLSARKAGIEVVAIHFGHEVNAKVEKRFRSMYERNCIVTTTDSLEKEIVRIVKRFVKN